MAVFHREMEFLASHSDALAGEFLNAEEKVLNSQMSVGELVTATMQAYLKKAPSLIAHLLDFVTCSQPTLRGPSAPSFLLAGTVE